MRPKKGFSLLPSGASKDREEEDGHEEESPHPYHVAEVARAESHRFNRRLEHSPHWKLLETTFFQKN